MLKKVLREVEVITSSRSGTANFESEVVEANELQAVVDQYLQVACQDICLGNLTSCCGSTGHKGVCLSYMR